MLAAAQIRGAEEAIKKAEGMKLDPAAKALLGEAKTEIDHANAM